MTTKRFFLEIGSGNDLHGGDYTKAAVRAVQEWRCCCCWSPCPAGGG